MAGLATKDEYADLARTVSLGIALLKKCRKNTWAELTVAMADGSDHALIKTFHAVDLTADQLGLISLHQPVLGLLRISPAVVPVICPVCDRYTLTTDTAPAKCTVTADCDGKPFKVAAAVTAKPVKETAEEPVPKADPAPEAPEPVADDDFDEDPFA